MWPIFTFLYNFILICFIAAHLLVGALISFGVGVYAGIYMSQNYELPRINEPARLWELFVKFTEKFRKSNVRLRDSKLSLSNARLSLISMLTTGDEEDTSELAALREFKPNTFSSHLISSKELTQPSDQEEKLE